MNRDTRLVALALLLWGFGEGLFLYIQPLYIRQLGANPVQIGGLLSAMSVVKAVSFLPAGMLADRLPRKWVMWGGWGMGLVGTLVAALARTWQQLVPGLLIFSLSAYCIPVVNAYLARAVNGHHLERTFTTVYASYAAGAIISPAIGGWLAEATTMRTVYFVSTGIFAISALTLTAVSAQPAPQRSKGWRWRVLLNKRFLRFAALTGLAFTAMYISFPLAPNFLEEVRGWTVSRIGVLGSFQALGTTLLGPLLGRLRNSGGKDAMTPGMMVGQALIWSAALLLLLTGAFPALAMAYVLRGTYQGCRSLAQARAPALGTETERGLLLGGVETVIAATQVIAPYAAGWLYAGDPTYPFIASLVLIPVTLLIGVVGEHG